MNSLLKYAPAVFVVGKTYQIMIRVDFDCTMSVEIGNKKYYDSSNGILKSHTKIHRITVPSEVLDEACEYTVCLRKVIERLPYFPTFENEAKYAYKFKPVTGEKIYSYMIADAHNMIDFPVLAEKTFEQKHKPIDFLILCGDIPNHSGELEYFDNIYILSDRLTGGEIPIVFARGNHDMRGFYAEEIEKYTPTQNGNSFFSFRLGSIWGLVLDTGEDKNDTHEEYNGTTCCHEFRQMQTDYLRKLIDNSKNEYDEDGVKYKIIVCHSPFVRKNTPPFDIEEELYKEWIELLKDNIKPDIMLFGHVHKLSVLTPDDKDDTLGVPCKTVIGSSVDYDKYFGGAGIIFDGDINTEFTGSDGKEIFLD